MHVQYHIYIESSDCQVEIKHTMVFVYRQLWGV